MFIGRYYHQMEAKGRVSLPKEFRQQAQLLILTRGLDGGLYLISKEEWTKTIEVLTAQSSTKKNIRDYIRLMANDAQEVEADRLGRILIPEYLRTFAHLQKDVVIVGSLNKIEIWDKITYHDYIQGIESKAEEIAEGIYE